VAISEARQPLFGLSFFRTFETLFGSEMDFLTFKRNLHNNIVQLEMQIEQGSDCMVGFRELKTQLKGFMTMDFRAFKNSWDYESSSRLWKKYFTSIEVEVFRNQLLNTMYILEMALNARSLHLMEMQKKKRDSNEKERSTSRNEIEKLKREKEQKEREMQLKETEVIKKETEKDF
jgi:hypothetical protein